MPGSPHGQPVIYGEVLFDHFPDGSSVLGGAPFNVAWHLAGFGFEPLLITRVGDDPQGEAVLRAMERWGMDTNGVQLDAEHATGAVNVSLAKGQPSFDIVADQAYDHIARDAARDALSRCSPALLYHGTLAARSPESRDTLAALRADTALPVFVDVNLRPPWWDARRLASLIQGARWVKLNDAELAELHPDEPSAEHGSSAGARVLLSRFGAETVILTRGAEGAEVVTADEMLRGSPAPVEALIDAVGAGDAFSAVFIAGILSGWSAAKTLERALRFASAVCGIRGATTSDRALYDVPRADWEMGPAT